MVFSFLVLKMNCTIQAGDTEISSPIIYSNVIEAETRCCRLTGDQLNEIVSFFLALARPTVQIKSSQQTGSKQRTL